MGDREVPALKAVLQLDGASLGSPDQLSDANAAEYGQSQSATALFDQDRLLKPQRF